MPCSPAAGATSPPCSKGTEPAYRMGGDEFCVIVREADADGPRSPQPRRRLSEHGKLFDVHCSRGSVLVTPNEMTLEQALQQADQRLYSNKRSSRRREGGEGARRAPQASSPSNSTSLAAHLGNVGTLAEAVARKLGLNEDEVTSRGSQPSCTTSARRRSPTPSSRSAAPSTTTEWEFMRRHTIIGERILAAAPALARIGALVRSTHERVDGGGYPDGLRADEIPLTSRIVAVVDAYDAMTNKRPYRLPVTPQQALAEIRRSSGSQFDTTVADAFVEMMEEHFEGLHDDIVAARASIAV